MDASIRIGIDGRGAQTGAQQVNRALDSISDGTKRVESSMGGVTAGLNAFRGIMGSIGVAFGVKEAIMLADSYNTLQSRIKTATKATGDYEAVSRRLFDISQANGISLKSTVSTFQSIARGAGELGKSNAQIITFVSTLQKLGTIGGSSAQEMEDGLRQLSQGLSGGIIRAEEWNSIVENTPEIAVRAARGIEEAGGSIGKLRKMMLDGTLTAQVFFDAIAKQAPEIEKEFASMPVSVERAMTALSNATQKAFGDLDKQIGGGTSALAQGMMLLANNMDTVAQAATVLGLVLASNLVGKGFGALTGGIATAIAAQSRLVSSMESGTAAIANSAQASQTKAVADAAAARAEQASALATLKAAQANEAEAISAGKATAAENAKAGAMGKSAAAAKIVHATHYQVTVAQNALAAANTKVAATSTAAAAGITRMGLAARLAAGSMGILKGAMAFFGGPIGVAITAIGAAIYYLSNRTKDAEKSQKVFNDRMEKLVGINAQLSTASGNRRAELETERQQVLKNADAEYALAEARLASLRAFQESGKKTFVDTVDLGAKRITGVGINDAVDAASNLPGMGALGSVLGVTAGDMKLDTTNKQIDDTTAALASLADQRAKLREEATKPIPALASSGGGAGAGVPPGGSGSSPGGSGANPGIPIDEGDLKRKVDAYKNATSEIINQTSKMAYVSQQVSGGDYAMEEAGMRYDLMEKAKEAGLYTSSEVENIKQVAAEYRRVSEEADNLRQSEEDKNKAISRSDEIWRSTLSPLEEYQIKLAELQDLHQQWIDTNGEVGISQSTLAAATAQLRDEINNNGFAEAIDPVTKYNDELKKLADLHQLFIDSNGELGLSVEQLSNAQGALRESMNSDGQAVFDETRTAAEKYAIEVERLNQLHQLYIQTNGALGISQDTLNRALEQSAQSAEVAGSGLNRLADEYGNVSQMMEGAALGALYSLEDGLVDIATGAKSAREAFADMAADIAKQLMRTAIQMAIIRPLAMGLGGMFAGGGVMTSSGPMSLPMYAKGGVMSPLGDLPLKTYATGGIADSPQMAIFGEGRMPEAYVPLPDGRRIPVKMEGGGGQGGGGGMSIVNNINVNMPQGGKQEDGDRFGQAIARQVEDAMNANLMKQQRPGGLLDPYGYGT